MSSVEPPEEDDSSLAKLGGSMLERLAKSGPGSSSGSRASRGIPKRRIWWPLVTPSTLPGLALIGMISALSGTGIVYVLNSESALVADYKYSGGLVLGFVAFLLVYRISQQLLISRTCAAMERALHDWRTRVSEKVLRLSLSQSEQMTKGSLHDGLAKSYAQISQTIVPMVAGAEAGILSLFMLLYLLSISLIAGALTIFLAVVLAIGYINTSVSMREGMAAAEQADTKMFRLAEELVGGFKELKLHPKKQQLLRADLNDASLSVAKNRSNTAVIISRLITTANSTSFLLAATVVFVLPILDKGGEANLGRLVTAVLFMLGPLGAMVSSTQQFAMARFRISIIQKFEDEVNELLTEELADIELPTDFTELAFSDVDYKHSYDSVDSGFAIKSLNFNVSRGQIVFITGANGSGKTTLMRVLTGLYTLQNGQITLDGQVISAPPPQAYRNLFSAVFADYHVFAKPYAIDSSKRVLLEEMLVKLRIRDKFSEDFLDKYSPETLSTGQHKRLALALALSENRPILVLDEWAADQDPETRAQFYLEILPELKANGKTIIAVTHDDRYFSQADVRYHMEEGHLEIRKVK